MRAFLPLLLSLAGLANSTVPLVAQTNTPSRPDDKEEPPSQIGGKRFEEWMRCLKSTDPGIRRDAVRAVAMFGKRSEEAVPELVRILQYEREDWSVRINAAVVMNEIQVRDDDV